MAYKILTRLGFLTGILFYTAHIGVWAQPYEACELTESLSKRMKNINSSGSKYQNAVLFPDYNSCFRTQRNYNKAIKRGFYFSYRLHDWKSEFLRHTKDLVLRTGAVFAVIIATRRYNIWDSSDDAVDVYDTITKRVSPYAKQTCEYLNIHVPPLPPQREKSFIGVYYYNQTIMTLVGLLNMCPTYIHAILEKVPGYISEFARRAREQYEKYQKQREEKNEKLRKEKDRQACIDEKALVQPLQPKGYKDAPKNPNKEDTCPPCRPSNSLEPQYRHLPDEKCKCPKCDTREADGWSDNKPKCPKRASTDRNPVSNMMALKAKNTCEREGC